MSGFDVQGARKAGYSDAEIADFLGQSKGFDVSGAKQAGYSDKEIVDHLAGPGPTTGERVMTAATETAKAAGDAYETGGNYRDTRFAKAMGGVAGIPRMMGDAVKWVGDKTSEKIGINPVDSIPFLGPAAMLGRNLPTGEQASQFMLDRAKARPGFKETNINPVVDAGVEALFSGPVMGAGGKMGPMVNAGAAMGGEAAGDIPGIQGTQAEPYARVAGSVLGGMTPFAIQKGSKAAMSLIEPFTQGGRDKIAGAALVKGASDPQAAIANMETYSPPVPGFQLPAGKASRDPGMMSIQEVAESKVPAMRGIYNENNAVLTKALDDTAVGLPPASTAGETIQKELRARHDALDATRRAKTDPLYDAARNSPAKIDPTDPWMVAAQAADETKGKPRSLMETVKGYFEGGKGPSPDTPKGMMAIRDAVGDLQGELSMGRYSKSLLGNVKSKIDEALQAVPEEKIARDTFAQYSKPLEPFDAKLGNKNVADAIAKDKFGKDFLMPAEKVPSQFMKPGDLSAPMMQKFLTANGGNPKAVAAMRAYVLDDFKTAALSKVAEDSAGNARMIANPAAKWLENNRGAAANILTMDQMKGLEAITKALKEQSASIPGRTGSPTFDRLATESILGAFLTPGLAEAPLLYPIKKALGIVYGGANEAAMNRLFEVIQDPKAAAALMRKANAGNVKMAEPILRQLAGGMAVSQSSGSRE